jgi:hypothetical protein
LQYFLASDFDMPELLACSCAMQSFICCLWAALELSLLALLVSPAEVDGLDVLGYCVLGDCELGYWLEGGVDCAPDRDIVDCAMARPPVASVATAMAAVNRFTGSSLSVDRTKSEHRSALQRKGSTRRRQQQSAAACDTLALEARAHAAGAAAARGQVNAR